MDIFNRPPSVSEDTLQYSVYRTTGPSDKASLTSLAALIESRVHTLLPNHIWHRDAFELKLARNSETEQDGWMLEGRMRVGDSVDDEWCVVWLLKEISSQVDVAINVFDSDGEFLLIESADFLPSWVNPTNAENRVWLYHSNLHIIPLSYTSPPSSKRRRRRLPGANESEDEGDLAEGADGGFIGIQDALRVLKDPSINSSAPKLVEDAVWRRISGYPSLARQHVHTAKAYLPVDVVKALSQDPKLVQRATEAFYTRDAIQLRAAHRMSRFSPQSSVLASFKITRTAYAQLIGQNFHPPKIFGQFKEREETREWKWRDVGMKIACGFEMLYQESNARSEGMVRTDKAQADARKDALRRNPDFVKYIENLSTTGFFQEELEGSVVWNDLHDKAAIAFINIRSDDDATRPSFASLVNSAILRAGDAPFQPPLADEESDDWLNVDAEDSEAKLAETVHSSQAGPVGSSDAMDIDKADAGSEADQVAQAQASKLKGLAKKIENFVEGEGTMEGAVFDDDILSDDEPMSEFSEDDSPSGSDDEDNKASRQEVMDKLVEGIDPSEYGQMPASFYSNSQKVTTMTMETETSTEPTEHTSDPDPALKPLSRPIRRPILPRDDFDGVDSDDETDEDDVGVEDEDSEEDRPQVVGDIEIDMAEEEEDFLKFSREALGISDQQWGDIVKDRKERGAFLPSSAYSTAERAETGARPNTNPNLDSFEAVMLAMDEELARARSAQHTSRNKSRPAKPQTPSADPEKPAPSNKSKGKGKASTTCIEEEEDEYEDVENLIDNELRDALEKDGSDSGDEEPMDYNLIKNFLESFKSQGGLSGPVGNLAGRLESGWKLPMDAS